MTFKALPALLLLAAAPASAGYSYGLRVGTAYHSGAMKRTFGSSRTQPEAYVRYSLEGSENGVEVSLGGFSASREERGPYGAGEYLWEQTLVAIPLRLTGRVGRANERMSFHVGAGATAHFATLERELSFSDPAQAALAGGDTVSKTVLGPHAQVGAEYFLTPRLGLAAFARYTAAIVSDKVFRGLVAANPGAAFFAQGEKLGNIGGPEAGIGLALRF